MIYLEYVTRRRARPRRAPKRIGGELLPDQKLKAREAIPLSVRARP